VQVAVIETCCDVCCTAVVAGARVRTRCCSGQDAVPHRSAHPRLSAGGNDTPMTQRAAASEADTPTFPMAKVDAGNDVTGFLIRSFAERMRGGYARDDLVSGTLVPTMNLRRDKHGFLWTADHRLVVPETDDLHFECFESVHSHPFAGHYGQARTLKKAEQLYYWPNMARNIEWCSACDSCQRVKAEAKRPAGHLKPLPVPGRRWESVSMDFITDLPMTSKGHDAIWVAVDRLSKMVHIEPIRKSYTAYQVACLYRDRVFRYHSVPSDIVSDRDPRFTSEFWRELMRLLGVRRSLSTAYHPQTDGQTERANAVLEDTLRHYVSPYQTDWDEHLAMAEFAMNAAYNHSVRNTPFMLNYGQHPMDTASRPVHSVNPSVNRFVGDWQGLVREAKRHLAAAQDGMKAVADKRMRPVPVTTLCQIQSYCYGLSRAQQAGCSHWQYIFLWEL
jgi:Integrase zinc binding domain/Integrase core domain